MKTWQYRLQEPGERLGGWAHVIIRQDGFFATVSDYGNYACGLWRHGYEDFRTFWLGMRQEVDYFCSKTGRREETDIPGTVQHVKEMIIYWRREGGMKREAARREWEAIKGLECGDYGLEGWMNETEIDCAYEYIREEYPPQLRRWAELFLPLLADAIEAELAAEAPVATP